MLKRLLNPAALPAIEQRAALLAGKHVTYTLKRSSRRRSIGLLIDDRGLIVSVPMRASERWLHSVLQDKAHWVVETLDGWRTSKPVDTKWADGEEIDYLGELLTLRVVTGLFIAPAHRRGNELQVFVANGSGTANIEKAVSFWYRSEAGRIFAERVAHFSTLLKVVPRTVKLSTAKTQWGCCTAHGAVHLNIQLVRLPLRLVDYVVAHELAHLRELNHSAAFWKLVESVYPDYSKIRNELKAINIR